MKTKTQYLRWLLPLLSALFLLSGLTACSSSDDADDASDFIQVPGNVGDKWVEADFEMEDVDLLTDFAAKTEIMRMQFIKMLSNNFDGKLFCGPGPKSDPTMTIECFTSLMVNKDKYIEAVKHLNKSEILNPTSKTRGKLGDLSTIFGAWQTEAEKERQKVLNVLLEMKAMGNADAQQQLYDYYKSHEPEKTKAINAKDAKDFFNKLNNGELNDYILNISNIWRDNGKLANDKVWVDTYAVLADESGIPYLKSAVSVTGKIAVATGNLYFSAIDDIAGGWGSKMIDMGDYIKDKITLLRLAKQTLSGKPNWQDINTYLVNQISGDIKSAIGDVLGDNLDDFSTDAINLVTEEISDRIVKMSTVEDADEQDEETAKAKEDKAAKEAGSSVIIVETDLNSRPKMVLVTDPATGAVTAGVPNQDGRVHIPSTPGRKIITVIDNKNKRITIEINAKEGINIVDARSDAEPYLNTNPREMTIDADGSSESAYVLTNCKYVKFRVTNGSDWCRANIKTYAYSQNTTIELFVEGKSNDENKERKATIVLEGYNDNSSSAKALVTYNLKVTQLVMNNPKEASVDPDELIFPANGGTERVTIKAPGYSRFNNKNIDAQYSSWLSAKNVQGGYVDITVQPNTTGQVRKGEVICYVTNEENPTEEQKILLPVKITQEAGNEEMQLFSFKFFRLFTQINLYNDRQTGGYRTSLNTDRIDHHNIEFRNENGDFKVTKNNNTYYVEASYQDDRIPSNYTSYNTKIDISFNVELQGNTYGTIKDLIIKTESYQEYYNTISKRKELLKATDLPNTFYGWTSAEWEAHQNNNTLKIVEVETEQYYFDKKNNTESSDIFKKILDNSDNGSYYDNYIKIDIMFNVDPDSYHN